MLTLDNYVGVHKQSKDWNEQTKLNADDLIAKVNKLLNYAAEDGVQLKTNPKTGSFVSGETFGGFRPQNCPIGAPKSTHKIGKGVDIFDPSNALDTWCMGHQKKLEECELWMESPDATNTWCHLQSVKFGSWVPGKRRWFIP